MAGLVLASWFLRTVRRSAIRTRTMTTPGPAPRRPVRRTRPRASARRAPPTASRSAESDRAPYRDVIADLLDQRHHVRAHHDRPARRDEAVQDGPHDGGRHRVHRLERLVEHEHPRPVQQRAGQADLLPHAGRVVRDQGAPRVRQVEDVEQLGGALADDVLGHPAQQAEIGQQLRPGQPLRQRQPVRQRPDQLLRRAPSPTSTRRPGRARRRCRGPAAAARWPSTAAWSCPPRWAPPGRGSCRCRRSARRR